MKKADNATCWRAWRGGEKWGRYSFLGFDPKLSVRLKNGEVYIRNGAAITRRTDDPAGVLREILSEYDPPRLPGLPPFTGGLVGYFAYDYIAYNERSLHLTRNDPVGLNDFYLMLFEKVIVFDHLRQKLTIIVNIKTDDADANYQSAAQEIADIAQIIRDKKELPVRPARLLSDFRPLFSKEKYCDMVERAKKHIVEGDIFQAVLSNRMEADFEGSLLPAYRVLRTINPSPYMFYLCMEDTEIAGASPETLISLRDGRLETFPIAGTCPRGKTEEEDEHLIAELLKDEKELSEHNMLVDLGRNDLGRISEFGSVRVSDYLKVMRFSHVSHITSRVTGKLRNGLDPLDAVASLLPAGTLSGAPKIRACEIIDALEGTKRGVYGGAIGYIDFAGNMDLCIAIRMGFEKGRKSVRPGGRGHRSGQRARKRIRGVHQQGAGHGRRAPRVRGGGVMILLIDNYDSFSYNLYQLIGMNHPGHPGNQEQRDGRGCNRIAGRVPHRHLPRPGAAVGRRGLRRRHPPHGGPCAHPGRVPGAPGHLRGFWRDGHLRQGTAARQDQRGAHRERQPRLPWIAPPSSGRRAIIRWPPGGTTLPDDLLIIAEDEDGEVMGVKHVNSDLYGLQFHPESVLTPDGPKIIRNFLNLGGR